MKNPRFWTSATRFWFDAARGHRPRVSSSSPDGSLSFGMNFLSKHYSYSWEAICRWSAREIVAADRQKCGCQN
jgi:hypothetical protein